jgi:Heparinase II/III-like protein
MKVCFLRSSLTLPWLFRPTALFFALFPTCAALSAEPVVSPARVDEIAAMLSAVPSGFGQPITNRAAWGRVAANPALANIVPTAEKLAASPVPELPDSLYLDYSRTGNRDRGQKVMFERSRRLAELVLAEGMEDQGRFVPAIQKTIEALCAEKSWTYPAHDGKLDVFEGRTLYPDLRGTTLGIDLGTAYYLLGDTLPGPTRKLLSENVRRRVLQPFRDVVEGRAKPWPWIHIHNNWNAVCLAGTLGAALAFEETPRDRAWFIAASEHLIDNYLEGFTPDGYCGEGIGYWNYGFGHFIVLTEELRQASGGKIDQFQRPEVAAPALFAFRSEITDGVYPSISDCSPGAQPDAGFVDYVSRRCDVPMPRHLAPARIDLGGLGLAVMQLFQEEPLPPAPKIRQLDDSPLRTWFKDGGVLIERPGTGNEIPFAAALKGGNNGTSHSHNDVGSFSVIVGRTMVVCDPGGEVYTRRTFGPQRYDSGVLNSFGHAVPIVARQLQHTGAEAKAFVLSTKFEDSADTLVLDIRSAYSVPELKKLERTFVYRRGAGAGLRITDDVAFDKPEGFESALITWGKWRMIAEDVIEIADGSAVTRVKIETGGVPFEVRGEEINEHVHTPKQPWHLGITLKPEVASARVTLDITPAH